MRFLVKIPFEGIVLDRKPKYYRSIRHLAFYPYKAL
jgi:hypothetical protein